MNAICANLIDCKRIFIPAKKAGVFDLAYAQKADNHFQSSIVGEEIKLIGEHHYSYPKKILDVGCNTGISLSLLCVNNQSEGMGIDINKEAIDWAKIRYPKLNFVVYDGKNIPAESGSFDCVTFHHAIAHVEHPKIILKEIYRVLKTNGTLSVITSNAYYKVVQFPSNLINGFIPDITVLRHYTKNNLLKLLSKCGFEQKFFTTFGPFPNYCPKIDKFRLRLIYVGSKHE